MTEIDVFQASITLVDGTVIQVLDENGIFDEKATAEAAAAAMNASSAYTSKGELSKAGQKLADELGTQGAEPGDVFTPETNTTENNS
jgi:hypothetical protein